MFVRERPTREKSDETANAALLSAMPDIRSDQLHGHAHLIEDLGANSLDMLTIRFALERELSALLLTRVVTDEAVFCRLQEKSELHEVNSFTVGRLHEVVWAHLQKLLSTGKIQSMQED
jgi:hypothetical protein